MEIVCVTGGLWLFHCFTALFNLCSYLGTYPHNSNHKRFITFRKEKKIIHFQRALSGKDMFSGFNCHVSSSNSILAISCGLGWLEGRETP